MAAAAEAAEAADADDGVLAWGDGEAGADGVTGTDTGGTEDDEHESTGAVPANMTKEERRKYINRMAARRSRRKKAIMQQDLEIVVGQIRARLEVLSRERTSLLQEVAQLERALAAHDRQPCRVKT